VTGPTGKKGLDGGTLISGYLRAFGKQVEKQPEKMQKWFEIQNWINSDPQNYYQVSYGPENVAYSAPYADSVNFPFNIPTAIWDQAKTISEGGAAFTHMVALGGVKVPEYDALGLYDNQINTRLIMPLPSASKYSTELDRIEDEAFIDIISGQKPVTYFDTFVAQWLAAGGDQLTKEAQTVPRTPAR